MAMVPSPLLKQVKACGIVCFDTIIYQVSNSSIGIIPKIYTYITKCHLLAQNGRIYPEEMLVDKKYSSQTSIWAQ